MRKRQETGRHGYRITRAYLIKAMQFWAADAQESRKLMQRAERRIKELEAANARLQAALAAAQEIGHREEA